jgi:hypothetical protein
MPVLNSFSHMGQKGFDIHFSSGLEITATASGVFNKLNR